MLLSLLFLILLVLAGYVFTALGDDRSKAFSALGLYYQAFWLMLVKNGGYKEVKALFSLPADFKPSSNKKGKAGEMTDKEEFNLFSAIWLYSLGLNFELWSVPHYRADSLRDDLIANFSNIAFPGTGFTLSFFCYNKYLAIFYILCCHPFVVMASAFAIARSEVHANKRTLAVIFQEELLCPKHWFALWRINSTLVAKHHTAHASEPKIQDEYRYENKWDFLELGLKKSKELGADAGFKVTPVITDFPQLVCKHKNIEGGMGIHMFKNAVHGGDWIIQERLDNCDELKKLLPDDAPLSTFRVITMADPQEGGKIDHLAMTFVWRAGRAGKTTDHSSILFAVDPDTLKVQDGKAFSNWYQVGRPGNTNLLSKQKLTTHPDTEKKLAGVALTCAKSAVQNCVDAHKSLMPHVPTIGWDVAVAKDQGSVLLEANLSCNFFGGIYDRKKYLGIVDKYYANGCKA